VRPAWRLAGAAAPRGGSGPAVCSLTGENLLGVVLPRGIAGNREECEVMVDQSRAVDSRRLVRALKPLPKSILAEVVEKLRRIGEQ